MSIYCLDGRPWVRAPVRRGSNCRLVRARRARALASSTPRDLQTDNNNNNNTNRLAIKQIQPTTEIVRINLQRWSEESNYKPLFASTLHDVWYFMSRTSGMGRYPRTSGFISILNECSLSNVNVSELRPCKFITDNGRRNG